MQAEQIRQLAVEALEAIKACDVVVLDTRKLTSMFDYMIVASAESTRQTKALARNLEDQIKGGGGQVLGIEGEQAGEWVLVDLGSVIVHIMQPPIRDYYKLEQLWGGEPPRRVSQLRRSTGLLAAEAGGAARL
ncbi:MAG TPA: ribosome silencing factor [Burkholderiales bacterium]|nr:ribosome silencing factor [Burkholderiales bacterium]